MEIFWDSDNLEWINIEAFKKKYHVNDDELKLALDRFHFHLDSSVRENRTTED